MVDERNIISQPVKNDLRTKTLPTKSVLTKAVHTRTMSRKTVPTNFSKKGNLKRKFISFICSFINYHISTDIG